ncbi:MAG: helix-turn-helix domain-containing protein [Candidatus Thermoplasmatota archaeon]|nr:helix-turn-helix domain-containing protein [Candidatus Thermoplasmatota archaeon]
MAEKYPVEAVIELERDDCKITQALMKMTGVKSVTRLKIEADETLHLVEKETFTAEDMKIINSLSKKVARTGPGKLWIYGKSCSACKALALSEAVVVSSKSIDSQRVLFRILMENRISLKKLIKYLEAEQLNPKMVEEPDEQRNEMSERELSVLKMCFDLGYFENDRAFSLTEIAKVLGISTSSLSETLRRAMKKTVRDYLTRKIP